MTSPMSYSQHARAVLRLGVPLIGGHVAQFAIGLTDTIMLGWYSVEALAAVVLGATYFFVIFIFSSGFAFAVMPLVAEADAAGDETTLRRVTRMGMWLSVIMAFVALPMFWFSGLILKLLGQEPEVYTVAQQYLRVAGLGLLPALLVMVLKSYLAALGRTRVVFWVTVVAAIVNAIANYALIFGYWGFPELGATGAAVASVLVQIVSLIGVVLYATLVLPHHELFARLWRPDWEAFGQVFRLGVPIGITSLSETSLFAASSVMMGWFGTVTLAAHGIASQLGSLAFMVHLGLANAATVRAGNALGRRDADHLARGTIAATVISLGLSVVGIIIFVTIPETLLSIFISPDEADRDAILVIGVTLVFMAALFMTVDGLQIIALSVLRGVLDTKIPMVIAAFSYWLVGVPSGYLFGFVFGFGGVGVWVGLVVGLTTAAILLMWRFWGFKLGELRRRFSA